MSTEPEVINLGIFLSEFNKESDRGAVLLAASILDEWLYDILDAYLIDGKSKESLLKGFASPLGTFSARTSLAHSLGLLMDHEFEEINVLRKVRNEFGHSWTGVSFESPKVSSLMDKLPWLGPDEVLQTPKNKFSFFVAIFLCDLLYRKRLVSSVKLQKRSWGNTARNNIIGKNQV